MQPAARRRRSALDLGWSSGEGDAQGASDVRQHARAHTWAAMLTIVMVSLFQGMWISCTVIPAPQRAPLANFILSLGTPQSLRYVSHSPAAFVHFQRPLKLGSSPISAAGAGAATSSMLAIGA